MAYFCTPDFAGAFARDPEFPVHLVPASKFVALGKITKHEEVKARGDLVTLPIRVLSSSPAWRNATLFVSHRWVDGAPDSKDNAQYAYVCRLLRGLHGWESMYVWIDFSCMKQDTPDLPTIRNLNIILAHCGLLAIVLPSTDPEGKEYSQRVWCVYEWLAALHFKPIILAPSQAFANTLLRHTTAILKQICHPNVFVLLDQVRVASRGNLAVAGQMLSTLVVEDALFVKREFEGRLQAFKAEDKAKELQLQTIAATDMHVPGGIHTFHDPRHPPSLTAHTAAAAGAGPGKGRVGGGVGSAMDGDSSSSDSELDRQIADLRNSLDDD